LIDAFEARVARSPFRFPIDPLIELYLMHNAPKLR
jgi:hypothetical protein